MIRVFADQRAEAPTIGKLLGVGLEVQRNGGAAFRLRDSLDGEITLSARLPANTRFSGRARPARNNFDPVGNNERGVETDTELTDQRGVLLLIAGQ